MLCLRCFVFVSARPRYRTARGRDNDTFNDTRGIRPKNDSYAGGGSRDRDRNRDRDRERGRDRGHSRDSHRDRDGGRRSRFSDVADSTPASVVSLLIGNTVFSNASAISTVPSFSGDSAGYQSLVNGSSCSQEEQKAHHSTANVQNQNTLDSFCNQASVTGFINQIASNFNSNQHINSQHAASGFNGQKFGGQGAINGSIGLQNASRGFLDFNNPVLSQSHTGKVNTVATVSNANMLLNNTSQAYRFPHPNVTGSQNNLWMGAGGNQGNNSCIAGKDQPVGNFGQQGSNMHNSSASAILKAANMSAPGQLSNVGHLGNPMTGSNAGHAPPLSYSANNTLLPTLSSSQSGSASGQSDVSRMKPAGSLLNTQNPLALAFAHGSAQFRMNMAHILQQQLKHLQNSNLASMFNAPPPPRHGKGQCSAPSAASLHSSAPPPPPPPPPNF